MTILNIPSSHPTLHPPKSEDGLVSWLRLLRSRRVGISTFYRLIKEHGSATAALEALPDIAKAAGVDDYAPCTHEVAQAELQQARKLGIKAIPYGSPSYPTLLAKISDPPPILWIKGEIAPLHRPIVALVGARNASAIGTRFTKKIVQELGEAGIILASGLARGIDTAAHAAALPSGSIAVMAGGVDCIYPTQNTKLAQDLLTTGLRLSEQPIGLSPQARHFPARNRIISGLAHATVVIEATAKSGSLITAHAAIEQGRDVFAVPGHPFDERATGCNNLIKDGAHLLRSAQDIIDSLAQSSFESSAKPPEPTQSQMAFREAPQRSLREASRLHQMILSRINTTPIREDVLIADLQEPTAQVSSAVSELEIMGKLNRVMGGMLQKRPKEMHD